MLEHSQGLLDDWHLSAVAQTALLDAVRGEPRSHVRDLAENAWADGALLHLEIGAEAAFASVGSALLFVDEIERELELLAQVSANREGAPGFSTMITEMRAWASYERGDINAAGLGRGGPRPPRDGGRAGRDARSAAAVLACSKLLKGEVDGAEDALSVVDRESITTGVRHASRLEARAQLRLAQHRPADALADAVAAGKCIDGGASPANPGTVAWRSTAALAAAALRETDRAKELVEAEAARARELGIDRIEVRGMRVLGVIVGGEAGLDLLHQAVAKADQGPQRLELMLALVDYGAALRRAKKRAAAREPLRRAIEFSYRVGAKSVLDRARAELAATGARPRRIMLSGTESLTPSEKRVADLASNGLTTRSMAEALFITPKTVEYHLRHIYQKLDVGSRSELAAVLSTRDERTA